MLLQEQTHKELRKNNMVPTNSLAFLSDRRRSYDMYSKNDSSNDPQRNLANRQISNDKYNRLFCDYSKYNGHTTDKCYKLHGYP